MALCSFWDVCQETNILLRAQRHRYFGCGSAALCSFVAQMVFLFIVHALHLGRGLTRLRLANGCVLPRGPGRIDG